jgi:hypothetical protein
MANITRARAIPLIVYDLNNLDPVNWDEATPGIPEQCFLIRFSNPSATTVFVSYDLGVTEHEVVFFEGIVEIYFQNNAAYSAKTNCLAKGTPIWLRGTADDSEFYISGYTYVE